MSRTYCGTAEGGTTRDASTASGSSWVAASSVTMSPELIVKTGLFAALKLPMFTVRGDGISVNSAAWAGMHAAATNSADIGRNANRDTESPSTRNSRKDYAVIAEMSGGTGLLSLRHFNGRGAAIAAQLHQRRRLIAQCHRQRTAIGLAEYFRAAPEPRTFLTGPASGLGVVRKDLCCAEEIENHAS